MAVRFAHLSYPCSVLRRKETTPLSPSGPSPAVVDAAIDEAGRPTPKGKPTPKRREAEAARKQRVKPPLTRREAALQERKRLRAERDRTRRAMHTGDERHFLERDKGPVRKFIRDYIDSRRTIAEYFLPLIVIILVLSFVPRLALISTMVWVLSMVLLIVDLVVLTFRMNKQIKQRFPDAPKRGNTFYAITRATQIRRLRLPKPAVKPGEPI